MLKKTSQKNGRFKDYRQKGVRIEIFKNCSVFKLAVKSRFAFQTNKNTSRFKDQRLKGVSSETFKKIDLDSILPLRNMNLLQR